MLRKLCVLAALGAAVGVRLDNDLDEAAHERRTRISPAQEAKDDVDAEILVEEGASGGADLQDLEYDVSDDSDCRDNDDDDYDDPVAAISRTDTLAEDHAGGDNETTTNVTNVTNVTNSTTTGLINKAEESEDETKKTEEKTEEKEETGQRTAQFLSAEKVAMEAAEKAKHLGKSIPETAAMAREAVVESGGNESDAIQLAGDIAREAAKARGRSHEVIVEEAGSAARAAAYRFHLAPETASQVTAKAVKAAGGSQKDAIKHAQMAAEERARAKKKSHAATPVEVAAAVIKATKDQQGTAADAIGPAREAARDVAKVAGASKKEMKEAGKRAIGHIKDEAEAELKKGGNTQVADDYASEMAEDDESEDPES